MEPFRLSARGALHASYTPALRPRVPPPDGRIGPCRRDPADLAREFEPSAQAIRNWVAQADRGESRGASKSDVHDARRAGGTGPSTTREVRQLRLERDILQKLRSGSHGRAHGAVGLFQFMSANQAVFPIAAMARSGHPIAACRDGNPARRVGGRLSRLAAARALRPCHGGCRVVEAVPRTAHAGSGEIYGAPRVHATLAAQGARHGRKRIARLMREAGLVGVSRRRGGVVTTRRDREARPAPDLVDCNFSAKAPTSSVGDITFVPTAAGFLYLAGVVDAWSRRVVGLVDGQPPADRTRARRTGDGHHAAPGHAM